MNEPLTKRRSKGDKVKGGITPSLFTLKYVEAVRPQNSAEDSAAVLSKDASEIMYGHDGFGVNSAVLRSHGWQLKSLGDLHPCSAGCSLWHLQVAAYPLGYWFEVVFFQSLEEMVSVQE